jgi:hypothetical protein
MATPFSSSIALRLLVGASDRRRKTPMMTEQFLTDINQQVEQHLKDSFEVVSDASLLGLDPRSGYHLYIGDMFIAVKDTAAGSLRYYGGFEYVDSSHTFKAGGYTFYHAECPRVSEALDIYHDRPANMDAPERTDHA